MKLKSLAVIAFGFYAACAFAEVGVTDQEVLIGAHTAESGSFAAYSALPRTIAAYFDKTNAKGGVFGRKIKFLRMDTQGDYTKTLLSVKKLVEGDHIFAMVGGQGTNHQAVYKYLLDNQIPDLFFSDLLSEYGKTDKRTAIPVSYSYESEAALFANHLLKNMKGKKVCFLVVDGSSGEDFYNGAKHAIEEGNAHLPANEKLVIGPKETADRNSPQANSQILKLKRDNCDAVMLQVYGNLAANSINYGFGQGFKPVWMVMQFNASNKFIELLPQALKDGVFSSTGYALSEDFGAPGWNEYMKLLQDNGIQANRAQTGYVTGEFFVEALKRAGKNLTRDGIVKAVESLHGWQCSICLKPSVVSKTHHWMLQPVLIVTKGGKWVLP